MSIQTTNNITREEAEQMAIYKYLEMSEWRKLKAKFVAMDNEELEDYIEKEFDNYSIIN